MQQQVFLLLFATLMILLPSGGVQAQSCFGSLVFRDTDCCGGSLVNVSACQGTEAGGCQDAVTWRQCSGHCYIGWAGECLASNINLAKKEIPIPQSLDACGNTAIFEEWLQKKLSARQTKTISSLLPEQ